MGVLELNSMICLTKSPGIHRPRKIIYSTEKYLKVSSDWASAGDYKKNKELGEKGRKKKFQSNRGRTSSPAERKKDGGPPDDGKNFSW